ncbi:MAG: 5'-nucleotidase C-terminal domain-containing protein [Prevotellaceae bacterium]|jgi:2',3'-cyclic-nucleotide 2'-phosphodiesterase (5'-nucleotidase family)|nr:5'-nucleotidase C-terminal domain-containing protein [Prevotellaceae bacterium]
MRVTIYSRLCIVAVVLSSLSCQETRRSITATGELIPMTAEWDIANEHIDSIIMPYQQKVDSIMSPVLGTAQIALTRGRPQSLLSNYAADILRESAVDYIGHPADIGLMNMGGLRAELNAGPITVGEIYEIFPFLNYLCILSLKGSDVEALLDTVVAIGGEGVSNVQIRATKDRKPLSLKVGGEAIDHDRIYTIATIDYLAEGNDRMSALLKAVKTERCNVLLRDVFINSIRKQTKQGKQITVRLDDRYIVVE